MSTECSKGNVQGQGEHASGPRYVGVRLARVHGDTDTGGKWVAKEGRQRRQRWELSKYCKLSLPPKQI